MKKIKFSHKYPKLWGQQYGKLIHVEEVMGDFLTEPLLEYDTVYVDNWDGEMHWEINFPYESETGRYPLDKKQNYLQLVFIGNRGIPFCTIRRKTPKKQKYYEDAIGEAFEIEYTNETDKKATSKTE